MRYLQGKCLDKKGYRTREEAFEAAGEAKRIRGVDLYPYRCKFCGDIHMSHKDHGIGTVLKPLKRKKVGR
jgi:hypothetical protein